MKKVLGTLALVMAIAATTLASTGSRVCCEPACDDCASCCGSAQAEVASCPLTGQVALSPSCN